MNIHVYKDTNELVVKTQDYLNSIFSVNQNIPLLFLSSGGSSLNLLNNYNFSLAPNITVTMLDERGEIEPTINNFSQFMQTEFYKQALASGVKFVNTQMRPNDTPISLAERYNEAIIEWLASNPDGKVVATIGLGSDGHIAGMMPFPENKEFFEQTFIRTDNAVVAYDASGKNEFSKRITHTIPYIRQIDFPIVFFQGENKREPWSRVLGEEGSLPEIPSRILKEMKNVEVFTDIG